MTYLQVRNSIRRLEYEYNELTNYGENTRINKYFDINAIDVKISQNKYENQRAYIVNKLKTTIKRKTNNKIKNHLLSKLLPEEISKKITEYFNELDVITFEIDIEYDVLNYPYSSPSWKLIKILNNGFVIESVNGIESIIKYHNEILSNDWSAAITLRTDLNYFLSKILKLMNYI